MKRKDIIRRDTMGTNYYVDIEGKEEELHIGKKSHGWKFTINENRKYYRTPLEFFEFLLREDVSVEDEYNTEIDSLWLIGEVAMSIKNNIRVAKGKNTYTVDGYPFRIGEWC